MQNPGKANEINLGNTDVVTVEPGDVIRITAAGGGGWGPAHERDTQAVLADVRGGFISIAGAAQDYGVVIIEDKVDGAASTKLRHEMKGRASNEFFGHSPGRVAHEKVWTKTLYATLIRLLWQVPVNWRFYIKHQLMGVVAKLGDIEVSPAVLEQAFDDLLDEHPQLRAKLDAS